MKMRLITLMLAGGLSAACASHDGTYSPACLAYAGSVITLESGSFEWTRFTDQVIVDEHGEPVNQFPGFPARGTYRIEGESILMTTSDGRALDRMYLHRQDGESYLYTAEEHETLNATGERAKCPLRLERNPAEK